MSEGDDKIVRLPPAQMPPGLATQLSVLVTPVRPGAEGYAPQPVHHPEAAEWLRRKREALARPSSRQDCYEWFLLLSNGVNGVTEAGFRMREIAIWEQCDDLPAVVWCTSTRKAVWDRTPHLPSPGEVRAVLDAHLAVLQREIRALQRIAEAPPRPSKWIPAVEPYPVQPVPAWASSLTVPALGPPGNVGAAVRRVMTELAERNANAMQNPMQTDAKDAAKSMADASGNSATDAP